jgi:hypothetical protein
MRDKKHLIVVLLVLGVLLVIVLSVLAQRGRAGKERVELFVAPNTATILIDGKTARSSVVFLSPGKHKIEYSLENFNSGSKDITVIKDGAQKVFISLDPANSEGQKYIEENNLQKQLETVASAKFGYKGQRLSEKYAFLQDLPINGSSFQISYGDPEKAPSTDQDPSIALYVEAYTPEARRAALERLLAVGIDPTSVEIVFENAANPFQGDAGE